MALKVLLLRSRLKPLQDQLQALLNTRDGFSERESELEHDIDEAQTDEERSVVEAAVDAFEQERSANSAEITRVQGEIDRINEEIRSLEESQNPPPAASPVPNSGTGNHRNERVEASLYDIPIART